MTIAKTAVLLLTVVAVSAQSPAAPPAAAPAPTASPAARPAPFAPCPSPRPPFATIATDPAPPVEVLTTQQFVIALRAVADGGDTWSLLSGAGKGSMVRSDGARTLNDVAFQNLDRPGQPPQTGGNATELWLFTAVAPGTATLTFGLMTPGATAPTRTTTYTVRVSPNVMVC
ncbi:MAG: hypothetical protein QOJ39_918 [Candidatus Eremiobacteraeota bacterium]|jgi:hypothetical protein|nr:hypothetical protein [Candidatus Eremiobacteraeota bacterium]